MCLKHNLFLQSGPRRDVEPQIIRIVLFKSVRDVMQVSTVSAHLGLESELLDWYRGATLAPYCFLVFESSPRTGVRLRYCSDSGSVSSNIYSRSVWKTWIHWTMNSQNHSSFQVFQWVLPRAQASLLWGLSKRVYPFFLVNELYICSKETCKTIKYITWKNSRRSLVAFSQNNNFVAKKRIFGVQKKLASNKLHFSYSHQSFFVIWRNLSVQNIKLRKLNYFVQKNRKICLPKQTF